MTMKIALIDNDFVVRAKTDLSSIGQESPFRKFLQQVKEELLYGQKAYLEIEDSNADSITFEISQFE